MYDTDPNWTERVTSGIILDKRWESFPVVPEIVLDKHDVVYFSVQGSLLDIEYCFEEVGFCDIFSIELLRPYTRWHNYHIKLNQEEFSLRNYQNNRTIAIVTNPEFHDKNSLITKNYIKFGVIIHNLNVGMLHNWKSMTVFIKKIVAKDGLLKFHRRTYKA